MTCTHTPSFTFKCCGTLFLVDVLVVTVDVVAVIVAVGLCPLIH